jgi:hypothetical protein
VPSYAKALKNVVSLLKPGGMLVLMGIFDVPLYTIGHKAFKSLEMEKQDVHNAIEAAGLKVLKVFDDDSFCDDPSISYKGSAIFHAQKNA